jgi:hypothetical protein
VGKVLKFDRQNGAPRKVKSEPDEPRGKVIKFPRQELSNNLESAEIGKTGGTNAPAVFFGCFQLTRRVGRIILESMLRRRAHWCWPHVSARKILSLRLAVTEP